jgi:hypothetical protein
VEFAEKMTSRKKKWPTPTRSDYDEFLLRLYFGRKGDYLLLCVDRAYLDFNRTLHGIAKAGRNEQIRYAGTSTLLKKLRALARGSVRSQGTFDAWHRRACAQVRNTVRMAGYSKFTFGHAQKWTNMSLKYALAMGQRRLPGFARFLKFAHIPVDRVMMHELGIQGAPSLDIPWSKMDNYDEYMKVQHWVRVKFAGSAPMAVEFRLWLDSLEHRDPARKYERA